MTGFRYGLGGYHTAVGLAPDLITLSKGLANGMALSCGRRASGGAQRRREDLPGQHLSTRDHPICGSAEHPGCPAQRAALARMRQVGMQIINGLNGVFASQQVRARAFAWSTMFDVVFANADLGFAFFQEMWSRGFLMQYGGRFMPSAALSDADVQAAIEAAGQALPAALVRLESTGRDTDLMAAAVRFAGDHFLATADSVRRWFTEPSHP